MKLSPTGRKLLIDREGWEPNIYRDSAGLPTIGVGHLLTKNQLTSGKLQIGATAVKYRTGLTRAQVEELFLQDLVPFENTVNAMLYKRIDLGTLTQSQYDALVSFSFNIGRGAFMDSTLLKLVIQGDDLAAAKQFGRWVYAGGRRVSGLAKRRAAEAEQFLYQDLGSPTKVS